ncbi:MAG TPA: tetratricopeptide repeat protein, partial [Armatimonadota bacterium]|nr:tetratricopeptide repeat protein [Armatimonadota bacterium]
MAHYLFGHALGAFGDYERALDELISARGLGYANADLHSAIGYVLHMQGEVESAMESYRKALDMDPQDTNTLFNYGKALIAQHSYVAARNTLEEAANIDPEDAEVWVTLGEVYEDLHELDLALEAYEQALRLEPESHEARCLAARVSLLLGHITEAELEFRQALDEDPDDCEAWAGLGEVLIVQERYHEAAAACRRALNIDPASPYSLTCFVNACDRTGNLDEARRAVTTALKIMPENPDLWYLLAGIEATADIPQRALRAYQKAVELSPLDAAAHAGIGWAFIELGRDYKEAEKHLLQSVRLAPDWYYPCIQLGELFLRMNNTEAAAEWFTRAYQIAPNEPEVLQILADP